MMLKKARTQSDLGTGSPAREQSHYSGHLTNHTTNTTHTTISTNHTNHTTHTTNTTNLTTQDT